LGFEMVNAKFFRILDKNALSSKKITKCPFELRGEWKEIE